MTTGDKDKKGFGGFGDLVSDVSKEVETSVPLSTASPAHSKAQNTNSNQQSSPPPQQPEPPPLPGNTHGKNNGSGNGWWFLVPVILFAIYLGATPKKEEAVAPAYAPAYEPSYEAPVSSVDSVPPVEAPVAAPADVVIIDIEEMPPVGSNLVLTGNQIRYCLAEDVRLSTIEKAIDSYSQYEVNRFNDSIEDYNSRCSKFKYRPGTLESIQGNVNLRRASLVLEGLKRLDSWREKASSLSGITAPAKDVQSIESQLEAKSQSPSITSQPSLSKLSVSERDSIESVCASDKYTKGPAAYNSCLNNQLTKLANAPAQPSLSALSASARASIMSVCASDKYTKGPAAYNSCLNNQLTKLANAPAQPDLSELSTSEQISINALCTTTKYYEGLVAYNSCLSNQLAKLANAPAQVDLSLSKLSTSERISINAVCSNDKYYEGLVAYNSCLSNQLAKLPR